jgi:microcystin-dependent protein
MLRKPLLALLLLLATAAPGFAATCPPYPYTFTNGTTADANQVNTDYATVRNCVVNNAAANGANSDITSLSALITPLSTGQGGTGSSTGQNLVPTGTVIDFASVTPPAGWLLCNGQAVSRSTYAALFAVIETTFGAGDGSTTFNVPDLAGRVTAGYDPGNATGRLTGSTAQGVSAAAIGNAGGEQAHTQILAELVSHNHGVTDPGHTHQTLVNNGGTTGGGNTYPPGSGSGVTTNESPSPGTTSNTTGISIQNAGGGAAFNVVQPAMVLAKMIKT